MRTWRSRGGGRPRALLLAATVAALTASVGLAGAAPVSLAGATAVPQASTARPPDAPAPAQALAAVRSAASRATATAPGEPCSALDNTPLPGLPGHDTATVTAAEVTGSGCQAAIEITDASDPRGGQPGQIGIDITLPDRWNGSYLAEGNGVYCSPANFATLSGDQWLAAGYVVSQDDCGHTGYPNPRVSPWVTSPGPGPALNWNRIDDFGYLAQHLMAAESKYVIGQYYRDGPRYSFWNGCSTGGRQGLMEAQRYPADFNGILAGAPAVNWDQFMIAEMWPQLVMSWSGDELPTCKETLVNTTLAARCPDQDGQADGVFDPRDCNVLTVLDSLIGTVTPCGTFTKADARAIQAIWQGPRLSGSQASLLNGLPVWFGQEPGTDLSAGYQPYLGPGGGLGLATTVQTPGGTWAGAPFIPSDSWFQNWIKQSTSWTYTDETYQQYWQDFMASARYDPELAADNPDLRAFRHAGGKLIMWQGLADQQIFTGDSINYYNQAVQANGGLASTQSFFRYFLAPSVAHCGTPGPGSVAPANPMQQVIDWVENGTAPAVLNASGSVGGRPVTRPLCPYPDADATYAGGDPAAAASYTCDSRPRYTNPFLLNGQRPAG